MGFFGFGGAAHTLGVFEHWDEGLWLATPEARIEFVP